MSPGEVRSRNGDAGQDVSRGGAETRSRLIFYRDIQDV